MHSVRDEVLDLLVKLAAGKLSPTETTDAIMSALKRGAGVVVKELVWELVDDDFEAEHYVAESPFGKIIAQQDESGWLVVLPYGDGSPWRLSTGFASQVQADLARRITSAVEPSCVLSADLGDAIYQSIRARVGDHTASQIADTVVEEVRRATQPSCVVTDEMVEAACAALQADVAKRHPEAQGGWPGRIPDKDLAIARNGMRLALTAALSSRTEEEAFQDRVRPWVLSCFGEDIAADKIERNDRFIEEALELTQACGYERDRAHALVDYVFDREPGEPSQEVGGVMVTLAAHCLAHGNNMHADGERELARISAPEVMAKIRAKQAAKPKGSALPVARSLTNGGE